MSTARPSVGEDRLAKSLGWFSLGCLALRVEGNARQRVAATAAAVAGVAVVDVIASAKSSRSSQRLLTAVFRGLAELRRARAFHPRGLMLAGELTIEEESPLPLDAGVRPVTARLSKGAGTPGGAPDILGLAVRIPPRNGFSRSWDLALSSSGSGALSRMVPLPVRRWGAARYGSIVPYRYGTRHMWLLAVPQDNEPSEPASLKRLERWVGHRPLRFIIHMGLRGDGWREGARLTLHTVLPDTQANQVAFDPMTNHPPELQMSPHWLSRIRERAYQGSRAGRGASASPSSSGTG